MSDNPNALSIATKAQRMRDKAERLTALLALFPDLHEQRLRWETVLSSKLVNERPEGYFTKHSCGCCSDAPLHLYFFVQRYGENIFSDPPYVCVGERNAYSHSPEDIWADDWESIVRKTYGDAALELVLGTRAKENKATQP